LSAIALKALATQPKDRYQSVGKLKQDIELFLEGRSVSAKQDSFREMAWKLVKRNKGASIGVGLALVVLMASLLVIAAALFETWRAKRETDRAYADYRNEQEERKKQQRDSAPALVGAARFSAENLDLDSALRQLDLASSFDPDHAPAYLLVGQVKIAKFDFAGADADLARYLKMRPKDADAAELHRLAQTARAEDGERLQQLAQILLRQKVVGLSNRLIAEVGKLGQDRAKLLPLLRQRIEASWPGLGTKLIVEKDGGLYLNFGNLGRTVRDLAPHPGHALDQA
jgi:hypothetical protein